MTGRLVAGVDSSTQSCKVVVCDAATGQVLRQGRAAHPEGTEVCAQAWWRAYQEATAGGLLEGVEAIAVGGQQHGMVTLDEQDALVRDALLWNDTRSAGAAADLVAELGGAEQWAATAGLVPVASFTITKLRWLAEHEPQHAQRTATVVLPHDWLTGQILKHGNGFTAWSTDRGEASGTGYWSAATGRYLPELLRRGFGRDVAVPTVREPAEPAGQTDSGMMVGPGTGDNMGAALGLGLEPGDVVVSLGTSGAIFADHDRPVADPRGYVAGFASATGGYLPLACTLNAARVFTAGAALIGCDLEQFEELARRGAPGAEGLTLVPYLDGERTPNLPEATGTLFGLTRTNATPANLARAYVEGMVVNLAECVDALADQGIPVRRVVLIGGAAASGVVQQIAPSLFGAPVLVPRPAEYVGRGAARQAAWCLTGELPNWPLELSRTQPAPGPESARRGREVRERYAQVRAQLHPATAPLAPRGRRAHLTAG